MIRAIHQPTPIIVVSGLPRSGTSLMMQMLRAGGVPIAADDVRAPDEHNPHGYFEFEAVKTSLRTLESSGFALTHRNCM